MPEKIEHDISASAILKITGTVLVLFFLWVIRDIVILLLISIIISSGLEPFVDYLDHKKVPRAVSVLSVYILAIGLVVLAGWLISAPMIREFKQIGAHYAQILKGVPQSGAIFGANFSALLERGFQSFITQITSSSGYFLQKTIGVFNGVIEAITILVVSFYLVAEKNGMKNFIYSFVPAKHHEFLLGLVSKIQSKIGYWMIGQAILSAAIFAFTFLGLTLLRVKFALVLAVLAGFFELVPYIGPIISAIPAIIFAYVQNPPLALAVLILYVLLHKTEGYFLVPKVMHKTVGVSPLAILVAILVGLKVAGIFGIVLAVPLAAALAVTVKELRLTERVAPKA